MFGWWILMGCLVAAALALAPRYIRRRQRRAQVSHIRAQVEPWLSALQSPAGGTATPRTVPPAGSQQPVSTPPIPDRGTDRRRPTVVLGASDPSTTVPAQELAS